MRRLPPELRREVQCREHCWQRKGLGNEGLTVRARTSRESACLESVRNSCLSETETTSKERGRREWAFRRLRGGGNTCGSEEPWPLANHSYTPCCWRANSWAFLQVAQRRQFAHPPVRQVSHACLLARESGTLEGLVAQQFRCVAYPFVNACTSAQERFLRI